MKKSVSLLNSSVRQLMLYSVGFFVLILLGGIFVIRTSYLNDISILENEYERNRDFKSNKYLNNEIANIRAYLKNEYHYLKKNEKEMIDSLHAFMKKYYDESEDKNKTKKFLKKNLNYPFEVRILQEQNENEEQYAKYLQLDDGKVLSLNFYAQNLRNAIERIAFDNIQHLHNSQISTFKVYKLPKTFHFNSENDWYCRSLYNAFTCYDKNWAIAIEFRINEIVLQEKLADAKNERSIMLLIQLSGLVFITLIGITFLYLFLVAKKKQVEKQIFRATQYFDLALNTQDGLIKHRKELKEHFIYTEFRSLSYALLRFIRKLSANDEQIKKHAYTDEATGLMNNASINAALKKYKNKENKELLFCFFNIENFRIYNSMYGRNFGDQVLLLFGYRIYCALNDIPFPKNEHLEAIEKKNKLIMHQNNLKFECIARVSADEFLLVQEIDKGEDAMALVKKYHKRVVFADFEIESFNENISYEKFKISAKVGYSVYPKDSYDLNECFNFAELAIGNPKAFTNGTIFGYTKEIEQENKDVLHLQQEIRRGIINHEFLLYYQPKVDCKSGKIVGAEALVRWQHNDKLLFPDSFIEICERSNLIISLGNEIIRMACEAQRRWIELGLRLKLSINLSTKQLLSDNIVSVIEQNIQGIDPNLLEFEITESFPIEEESSIEVINKLKALNISLSMDDFGKGYSSLSYLNNEDLGFDVIKIDKCFIQNLHLNDKDKKLVEFILKLIKELNKKAVAEGVENEEILQYLQSQGCDEYQGYYFSKPIPEKQLLEKVFNND